MMGSLFIGCGNPRLLPNSHLFKYCQQRNCHNKSIHKINFKLVLPCPRMVVKISGRRHEVHQVPCSVRSICSVLTSKHQSTRSSTNSSCRHFATYQKQRNHYEVLNISRTATTEEIRQSFLKLSKIWHPDKNTADPTHHQKFVQINEAYSVLSKPLSRRDYDLSLDAERYVSRQMSAAASRSHTYGYSQNAGAYYHYRDHVYEEPYWDPNFKSRPGNIHVLFNFYMLMACATIAFVSVVMNYMYSLPNPKHSNLRNLTPDEVEKHQFIMKSEQDGVTVYYYAIPMKDSKKYEIAVLKESGDKESGTMHELTRSST